jgi:hypothetical protein
MLPTLAAAAAEDVAAVPVALAPEDFEEAALATLDAALEALDAALSAAEERALEPEASTLETADETDAAIDDETSRGTL